MKRNIGHFDYCYGCGVCSAVCNKRAIQIELDSNGFYKPLVDDNKCVNCGICLDVCSFNHSGLANENLPIKSWAAWSNDETVRKKCSSGGISFEIGKQLIERGFKAVGCRYDIDNERAEHYIASTVEEFVQSIGSKYIQSYTESAFRNVDRKEKYLITGTPCQIDSFRRMIIKNHCEDNFVLMDFFCHCVPSLFAWKAYIKMLEPRIGRVTYASWRNKYEYGWHDNWLMGIDGVKTAAPVNWQDPYSLIIKEKKTCVQSRKSQGDLFYKLFLGDVCHGNQCSKDCKFKYMCSSADIRIGDLWGKTYREDQKGVSALVAYTDKGESVINELNNVTLIVHPFEIVAEGQMKSNAKKKELYPIVMYLLKNGYKLDGLAFRFVLKSQQLITKIGTIFKR